MNGALLQELRKIRHRIPKQSVGLWPHEKPDLDIGYVDLDPQLASYIERLGPLLEHTQALEKEFSNYAILAFLPLFFLMVFSVSVLDWKWAHGFSVKWIPASFLEAVLFVSLLLVIVVYLVLFRIGLVARREQRDLARERALVCAQQLLKITRIMSGYEEQSHLDFSAKVLLDLHLSEADVLLGIAHRLLPGFEKDTVPRYLERSLSKDNTPSQEASSSGEKPEPSPDQPGVLPANQATSGQTG